MRKLLTIAFALLCYGVAVPCHAAADPLEGDWSGGFHFDGTWATVNIRFTAGQGGVGGIASIVIPTYGSESGLGLTSVTIRGSRVHFEIPRDSGAVVFDGQLRNQTIAGTYRYSGTTGAFGLTRLANIAPEIKARLFGAYRLDPNTVISIGDTSDGGNTLWYINYRSGQVRVLYALSEYTFFAGPGRAANYPVTLKVSFVKNAAGEISKLLLEETGGACKNCLQNSIQGKRGKFPKW